MFINVYECPYCGVIWEIDWERQCNDRCPFCRTEVEPFDSYDDMEDESRD